MIGIILIAFGIARSEPAGPLAEYEARLARGRALLDAGDLRGADDVWAQAFDFAVERNLPPAERLRALFARLDALDPLYDFVGLRDVTRRILEIQEAAGDRDAAMLTQGDLGYFESVLLNREEAVALLDEAYHHFRAAGDVDQAAQLGMRLSIACLTAGRWNAALAHALAAEAWFRKQGDKWSLCECLQVLTQYHVMTGDFETAGEHIREALSLDPRPIWRSVFLLLRAEIDEAAGADAAALELRLEAAACFEKLNDTCSQAAERLRAARLLLRMGRVEQALTQCDLAEKAGAWHPAIPLEAAIRRADAALARGEAAGAIGLYTTSISGAEALPDRWLACEATRGAAAAKLELGDAAGARVEIVRAIETAGEMVAGLPHVRAALTGQSSGARPLFELARRIAAVQPDVDGAFDLLERTRAGSISALPGPDGPAPADADLAGRLKTAREYSEACRIQLMVAGEAGQLSAVGPATGRYRKALRDYMALEELVRGGRRSGQRVVTLGEARSGLAPSDALVLHLLAGDRLRALVVRPDGARMVDLCTAAEMQETVAALLAAVGSKAVTVDTAGARRRFVDPLRLPPRATRVLLGPDGPLAALPWELLLPEREVVLVPSASALAVLSAGAAAPGRRVLALGAPDCSAHQKKWLLRAQGRSGALGNLPRAADEVRAISRDGDARLLGPAASEAGFRERLPAEPRWRAIHFACHALANPRRPAWTALALTPGGEDDGFLTVLEIFGLRTPADLVVLSACESGLGAQVEGEGLLGLPAAFLHSGASRVLASLWKVDDEAARALMAEFYALWHPPEGPGLRAPEALKRAQASVRSDPRWAAPFYWAAWVLWGLPD